MVATSSQTEVIITDRALVERRKLGAYYTPERLSKILSYWAIREADDAVLEPSFGGCGFLAAARDALGDRGCECPPRQIFGCDIDEVAFGYLATVFGGPTDASGFILKDFLDCENEENWPERFSVILANPPYIPHHRIGKARVRELWARQQGIEGVGGRAGLWAYFISHSVRLLAIGGRMAWVLPGAFLQADYAAPIRKYLGDRFDRCAAFLVRERLFLDEGTDEETVILLADGHRSEPRNGRIEIGEAETLDELEALIAAWGSGAWKGVSRGFSPAALSVPDAIAAIQTRIARDGDAKLLGDIARVQIGLVTGDNRFFVLGRDSCEAAGLEPHDCIRILSKFKAAVGATLTGGDLCDYSDRGGRTFLVSADEPCTNERVKSYLDTFGQDRKADVSTFRKRRVWSKTSDGNIPDAFFPVMHHTGPQLILNPEGFNCTNTIHRVFFLTHLADAGRKLVAISMLTTFSQLSAELVGRRYGSGVLKHEPRDAERIELLLPNADEDSVLAVFSEIDATLRAGEGEAARRLADDAILSWSGVTLTDIEKTSLKAALDEMRVRRRPDRKSRASGRSTSSREL
jgi:adenine-specific DNA-methyltransferase